MWSLIAVAIVAIFGTEEVQAKIIPATLKEFGFMALVYDVRNVSTPEYKCSGVLLTKVVVFTTCECIGSFHYDSSLNLVFTPINWKRYRVRLGYDGRVNKIAKDHEIEGVLPYQSCSFGKVAYFIYNLGAIKLKKEVVISAPLSLAPKLLDTTRDAIETKVLDMIYNEDACTVVGFGSSSNFDKNKLQAVRTRFLTFIKCSDTICFNPNECLKNVDIANNDEMCASAKNESDNCAADPGSPLICDSHLTGIVKYVGCNHTDSPILLTRLGRAVDFYNMLTGNSFRLSTSRMIITAALSKLILN